MESHFSGGAGGAFLQKITRRHWPDETANASLVEGQTWPVLNIDFPGLWFVLLHPSMYVVCTV